jgi:hypothetical protein
MKYCLYTLVDITATGQYRSRNDLERLQQQNFDTVIQTIGLAGNVYYSTGPEIVPADVFGNAEEKCWRFEWEMEIDHLFEVGGDELYRLKELFQYVPVITGLTETALFEKPIFKLGTNIIFDFKQ